MSYLLLLIFLVGLNLLFLKSTFFKQFSINTTLIIVVFNLKFLLASTYILYQNQHKTLTNRTDYDNYLSDSKLINSIFYENPLSYLKIVTGISKESENNTLLREQSELWFSPHQYLVDYRIVSRTHSIIEFFAFGNEYIHLLFVAFVATFSLILLVAAFQKWLDKPTLVFTLLGICFPSLLLFGGIISKDYILIFGLSCFLFSLTYKKWKSLFFWLGLILLLLVKIYIFIIAATSLLFYFILSKSKTNRQTYFTLLSFLLLCIGTLFSPLGNKIVSKITISQFQQRDHAKKGIYLVKKEDLNRQKIYVFDLEDTLKFTRNKEQYKANIDLFSKDIELQSDYYSTRIEIKKGQSFILDQLTRKDANSYLTPNYVNFNSLKFLQVIPYSIYITFTQPNFLSIKDLKYIPFAFGTLCILIFTLFALGYSFLYHKSIFFNPLILSLLIFILLSAFIVGISGPTVGALVRYRIPTYLILIIMNFILINPLWKKKSP